MWLNIISNFFGCVIGIFFVIAVFGLADKYISGSTCLIVCVVCFFVSSFIESIIKMKNKNSSQQI